MEIDRKKKPDDRIVVVGNKLCTANVNESIVDSVHEFLKLMPVLVHVSPTNKCSILNKKILNMG